MHIKSTRLRTQVARDRLKQQGATLVELAIVAPLAVTTLVGLVSLDRTVQMRRTLEWAVGETMLGSSFAQDVAYGSDGTSYRYTFVVNNASQDPAPSCATPAQGAPWSRCQAAYQGSLLLARAVRATPGSGGLESVTVSFRYQDISAGSGTSPALSKNRLLTVQAAGSPAGSGLLSLWPAVVVERTEAIG